MLYSKSQAIAGRQLLIKQILLLVAAILIAGQTQAGIDIYNARIKPPANIKLQTDLPVGIPKDSFEIIKFLNQAQATDGLFGQLIILHDAPMVFSEGITPVTFSSVDFSGKTITAEATVTVEFAN